MKCNKQETHPKIAKCQPKVVCKDIAKEFERELARIRLEIKTARLSDLNDFCFIGCNYFKFDGHDFDRIERAVENKLIEIKQDLKSAKVPKKFINAILKDKAKKLKKREIERRAFYQEAITLSKR
ncbi:hypothetical protein [Campylobacter concisus]|jgi:hypothetical protein|uniref:hypothetical protein n=1 Tax=Campylobacter concisus TaxID=199 RepID=UPI000CD86334|nr:hypothetical protein [Campylobacter concisus]